jgi:hypothetical protein
MIPLSLLNVFTFVDDRQAENTIVHGETLAINGEICVSRSHGLRLDPAERRETRVVHHQTVAFRVGYEHLDLTEVKRFAVVQSHATKQPSDKQARNDRNVRNRHEMRKAEDTLVTIMLRRKFEQPGEVTVSVVNKPLPVLLVAI